MGLVPGAVAARTLLRVAGDERELLSVRMAAVAAFGDRGRGDQEGVREGRDDRETVGAAAELLWRLGRTDGELAGVAQLAAFDLTSSGRSAEPDLDRPGLTIAQLFLHADLDREGRGRKKRKIHP